MIAGDTIANTVAQTMFASSEFTLLYRSLQPGSRLNLMARGVWSSDGIASSMKTDLVFNVSGVNTVVATTGSRLQSPGVTNQGWEVGIDVICRVGGPSGFSDVQGYRFANTGPASSQREDLENTGGIYFNQDLPLTVSLWQTWNVSATANSIEMTQFSASLWGAV